VRTPSASGAPDTPPLLSHGVTQGPAATALLPRSRSVHSRACGGRRRAAARAGGARLRDTRLTSHTGEQAGCAGLSPPHCAARESSQRRPGQWRRRAPGRAAVPRRRRGGRGAAQHPAAAGARLCHLLPELAVALPPLRLPPPPPPPPPALPRQPHGSVASKPRAHPIMPFGQEHCGRPKAASTAGTRAPLGTACTRTPSLAASHPVLQGPARVHHSTSAQCLASATVLWLLPVVSATASAAELRHPAPGGARAQRVEHMDKRPGPPRPTARGSDNGQLALEPREPSQVACAPRPAAALE